MTVLAALAFRNLRRHLRRTVLTSLAMIVGGALLMISLPLGDGIHEKWIESGVRIGSGHLSIETPAFQRSRRIEDRLPAAARAEAEAALADPAVAPFVTTASPQLVVGGLVSSAGGARPCRIVGVDSDAESVFTILDDKVIEGRYLKRSDRLAAYVGWELADALALRVGSRLVVTAQDSGGDIAGQLLRVVGVFRTGVPAIDQSLVHVPLSTAGSWLGSGADVTNVAILAQSSTDVERLRRSLVHRLAGPIEAGELAVLGWRELMPELDAAVRIDDFGNYFIQAILFFIIALGIVNTVLMSVLHRHREFGMLKALGLTPAQTAVLVLVEGIVLTVASGLIGIVLGLSITWFFGRDGLDFSGVLQEQWSISGAIIDPIVVPIVRWTRVLQALFFILLVGAMASLYPAFRASRIDVTEAMRFDR